MTDSPHLLVVDDESAVRDLLQRYFSGQGFAVATAADGDQLRAAITQGHTDVILLDLGLPGEDGFELTRELRKTWNGALIIVTGRDESVDRIVGLELGADDYVTKPFNLRELLARVRSVLRRSPAPGGPKPEPAERGFRFAGFTLDTETRVLRDAQGASVALTAGEYELLATFLRQPNRVLSRDALMEQIHGHDAGPYDRAIDVQIGRLRRKIEVDPTNPEVIKSVRGAGYILATRVTRQGDR